ncbi:hypothetical protein [Gordonia sp. (in: high G+C Gram-positive bacteria)]|uniref:hypothetical protein n=1 Tax=Gordonia sp. (in: high G+C Gram-positive bacteria) TaxID=84139 RepID=UPI003341B32F
MSDPTYVFLKRADHHTCALPDGRERNEGDVIMCTTCRKVYRCRESWGRNRPTLWLWLPVGRVASWWWRRRAVNEEADRG